MITKLDTNIIYRFLFLFISPINGWKKIKNLRISSNEVAQKLFYPIIAFTALSVFMGVFYIYNFSIEELLKKAIIVFASFFFANFLIHFLSNIFLKKDSFQKIQTNYGKIFIMINLSTLSVFYILLNIFPILEPILVFTPIYTAYLVVKGCKLLRFSEGENTQSIIVLVILNICTPLVIGYLLSIFLPTNS